MSEPNGGGNGVPRGRDGRLDGLAGGAASADGDTTLMPPPPPRMMKKPLQASLNPLLVGATVVSASGGPPTQRLNGDATTTTSTSTSTSSYLPSSKQPPPVAPAPLAKRSRRGKIPLEKGYSQVEWLRRSRERRVPPPREITPRELSQHSSPDDCWTALRGKVYDLTPYLKFHPGGSPLLAAVAGKDATRVFDAYHAWVNAGALLASCLVGKLVVENGGGGEGEGGGGGKAEEATVEGVEAAADAAEAELLAAARGAAVSAALEAAKTASVAAGGDGG